MIATHGSSSLTPNNSMQRTALRAAADAGRSAATKERCQLTEWLPVLL
jgi:hypothetical protein